MAKNVEVKLNVGEVRALRKSKAVQDDLKRRAERIAAAAGPDFEVQTSIGRSRARAVVIATTYKARQAEAERRALSNAVMAGR